MSNKKDRIRFVSEVRNIILRKGGAEIEECYGNGKVFSIPTKNDVLTIHLLPEDTHKEVYSVFARYKDGKKHNFHEVQRKGENIVLIINSFKYFLEGALLK